MKPINGVIYAITALVIFAQGLYFSEQWMMGLLMVLLMLSVVIWRQGELHISKDPVLIYLVINLCLHGLGYMVFVEKGMLIFGLLKACFYVLFYLLLMQIRDEQVINKMKEAFVGVMVVSGVVASLLYMTEWFPDLAFVIDDRLAGPLQYANTYGILLVAAIMLVVTIKTKPLVRYMSILLLVIPILLTMSRAVYLIGFVMIALLLITSKVNRATYGAVISSIIVGIVLLKIFDQSDTAIRLTEVTGASEWQSRLLYYKDALTMILKHPLGYGSNGYHYAQSFYQTGSTYHVKYVHSSILQSFLETGMIGGVFTSFFMAYAVFGPKIDLTTRWVVMVLIGHSLIDMDLQFPVVWLLVLVLLYRSDVEATVYEKNKVWPLFIGMAMTGATTLWLLSAVTHYNQGDYREAINGYEWYTEAYRKLLSGNASEDQKVPYAQKLVTQNPYITELYPALINYYGNEGDYGQAVQYAEDYVIYSPLLIDHHVSYGETLTLAATYYMADGDYETAEIYAKAMLLVPGNLAELAKEKNTDYNVNHKPDLTMNDALMDAYIEAGYIMEKIEYGR